MSDENTIELNRRRVLGGVVTIGAAAAAAGAGTFAAFTDSESSTGNTISAGTLSLSSPSNAVFTASDIVPGDSIPGSGTTTIQATYENSSTVDPAEVDFSASIGEPSEPTEPSNSTDQTASQFASQLNVDTANLTIDGASDTDLTSAEGVSTLDDLAGLSLDDAYGEISPGQTVGLELAVTFDSGAGNAYQADGVSLSVTFDAEQPSAD